MIRKEYTIKINGVTQSTTEVTSLSASLDKLDKQAKAAGLTLTEYLKGSKGKTSALTEEEKAATKLEATQKRLDSLVTDSNKKQIAANETLKEHTRELTRKIQIEKLAEGSLARLRLEANALNEEYSRTGNATEEEAARQQELQAQLAASRDRIRELAEGAGDYRDSVGHYEKGAEALKKLSDGVDQTSKASMGLAQSFLAGSQALSLFGIQSEDNSKTTAALQKALAILALVQGLNTNLLKQNIFQSKASAMIEATRTVQIKAAAAAETARTKSTWLGVAAQKAFNVVAGLNPYVLLGLALVSVVGALALFVFNTETAAEKQERLNEQQKIGLELLAKQTQNIEQASTTRAKAMEREISVLTAQGGKETEIAAVRAKIIKERKAASDEALKLNDKAVKALERNQKEAAKLERDIAVLEGRLAGDDLGRRARKNAEKLVESYQATLANTKLEIEVGVKITEQSKDVDGEAKAFAEGEKVRLRELAKTRAKMELEAQRALEDSKISLQKDSTKREAEVINSSYARQIEDLKIRLAEDATLTRAAKDDLRELIKSKEEEQAQALAELRVKHEQDAETLRREAEDRSIAAMPSEFERRRAEIEAQAERETSDTLARLNSNEALIEGRGEALTAKLADIERKRSRLIGEVAQQETERRNAQALTAAELYLREAQSRIGELVARDPDGLQLIDVDKTRENYAKNIASLDEYIARLQSAAVEISAAHTKAIEGKQEGAPEYISQMQMYGQAVETISANIIKALGAQDDAVRASEETWGDYYDELGRKVRKYTDASLQALTSVTDTLVAVFQEQMDSLSAQMDGIDSALEEATQRREASANRVEELEEKMQSATGGTAAALKESLQIEMANRAEAAREEQRLQREKEKKEAEIAKKAKQIKRSDLASQIAQGIVGTGLAVIQALTLGPILGPIFAAIIGAMGAAQIAVMTRQLVKLEDGGYLNGPSHAAGGMRIAGTNIEVEGTEFVENRHSTRNNRPLVEFINDYGRDRPLTLADLAGVVPDGGSAPIIVQQQASSNDRIIEAIEAINFTPRVSVVDILDKADEVTEIRDLAGF